MSEATEEQSSNRQARVVGSHGGQYPGPSIVLMGGLHGNEPAGLKAVTQVMKELAEREVPVRGRILGLVGNRAALENGVRYIERDLNRGWATDDITALLARDGADDPAEDAEQRELIRHIAPLLMESRQPVLFFDLHSTSADGPPFACMSDTLRNRVIALELPVPVILGLEEVIHGALLGYLSELGHIGVAFEGGRHDADRTVALQVAAIWLILAAGGAIDPSEHPELEAYRRELSDASKSLPRVVEISHRQVAKDDSEFKMNPGYASFQPVSEGTVVARDRTGDIPFPETARILLPRYQGQGDDAFFVARDVHPLWLSASTWIRRHGLDRLLQLLPGVRVDPEDPDRMWVHDDLLKRPRFVDCLHLCGFRRRIRVEGQLIFARRRSDGRPPRRRIP